MTECWILTPKYEIFLAIYGQFHCVILPASLCHASGSTSTYLCVWIWLIPFNFSLVENLEHIRICEIRGHDFWQVNTEEPHCTGSLFLDPAALTGFFFVRSPSPLESWGNCTLIPPILGKSMVIKLTGTWRLSWMPVTEKEDYCHFLRSSRNPEQRVVVK